MLYKPLNISLYLCSFLGLLSLLLFIVLSDIYISLNSILVNFACFWTLYKWYHFAYVLLLLFVFVRFIMLKGIAVVCLFSLLYNISFNVYTKIHLSSIHLVNVWVFSSFFCYSKSCCYENSYTCLLVHISKSFTKIYAKGKILSSTSLHNAKLFLK